MSVLDGLDFVKKVPNIGNERVGISLLDRARKKLIGDIDVQISLANDPAFEVVKEVKKRTGGVVETRRKPKSWASVQNGVAFITVRFSNKPIPLGGKRGSVIKCSAGDVTSTLAVIKDWVQSEEASEAIEKMMKQSKRPKK